MLQTLSRVPESMEGGRDNLASMKNMAPSGRAKAPRSSPLPVVLSGLRARLSLAELCAIFF